MKTLVKFSITLLLMALCICEASHAQTHRLRFNYLLNKKRIDRLAEDGIYLKHLTKGNTYTICPGIDNRLKADIVNKDGTLIITPWTITEEPARCKAAEYINDTTKIPLIIKFPVRVTAGDPVVPVRFHYQTWVVGVNSFGLKVRPKVRDFNGKQYQASWASSNFNLGFSGGYSFGWTTFTSRSSNSFSITPGAALGFSAANLSNELLSKEVDVSSQKGNLILSPAISCILARNEIGLILTYGWDRMLGKNADAWAYQGKRFFGLGVSASFKL